MYVCKYAVCVLMQICTVTRYTIIMFDVKALIDIIASLWNQKGLNYFLTYLCKGKSWMVSYRHSMCEFIKHRIWQIIHCLVIINWGNCNNLYARKFMGIIIKEINKSLPWLAEYLTLLWCDSYDFFKAGKLMVMNCTLLFVCRTAQWLSIRFAVTCLQLWGFESPSLSIFLHDINEVVHYSIFP